MIVKKDGPIRGARDLNGKTVGVVHVETRGGCGQRDHPVSDADADVVDLVRPSCRVAVVDDHDAFRYRHAAGRPCDQRPVFDQHR